MEIGNERTFSSKHGTFSSSCYNNMHILHSMHAQG